MHRLLLNQWSKYLLYVFFCDTAATTLIQWLNSFLVIQTLKVFMKVQYARYCSNAAQFSSKIKLKTEMWYCQRAELYNFLTCHWWLMHDPKKKRKFLTCLFQMVSCTLFAVLVYGHFATKETPHQPIVSSNFWTMVLRELSTLNGELTGSKTSFSGERTSSRCIEVKDWVCFVMWF